MARVCIISLFSHIGLLSLTISNCLAQNLVPNPDFEEYTQCPESLSDIVYAVPWDNGNAGLADFFHVCSPGNAGVPDNYNGNQWPVSGLGYSGVMVRQPEGFREYIRAPLIAPLISGTSYVVSFYVNPAEWACRSGVFGALFTIGPPVYSDDQELPYIPQVEVNGDFLGDYESWALISRCFVADGGENYITMGNFRNNDNTPPELGCGFLGLGEGAYYYIDQISVVESPFSEGDFILDPVTACDSFEIFPGNAQSYLWENGTTTPTLTVYESGTYSVTLSDECAFEYGEIEVTIIPTAPPVVLPQDGQFCAGDFLEIELDEAAGDYLWQDNITGGTYTITSTGTYSVSLTDECETTSDTININFLDPPTFLFGEDTLICDGDALLISFDPDLGDFEWQDQSNSSSYTINDDGTYALTISNMCGEASDEIEIEFVEQIVFSIGPDQMLLCDGEEVELDLDPALGEFLWNDNSTGSSYTITGEGIVSVTISNACYTETDEMLVDVLYQPVFTLGPDLTVCSGQFPITLNMSGVDHAQSWEWTGGSTQSIFQITEPGTYSVTISNDCFAMSDEIVVSIGDVDPVVDLPPDQLLCPGQFFVLDAGNISGSYQWNDLSTADTFLVTSPGQYMLTVTTSCGSGADTVVIDYVPALASPDLGTDISLCPGETAILYAGVENVSYQWSEGSTGTIGTADSIAIVSPGTYSLQISDACSSVSDTVVVTTNANPPDVDLLDPVDLCQGDTVVIDAGVTGVQYIWSDASQLSSLSINAPGSYSLTVSNACGSDADTIIINDAGPAPSVSLGADFSLCPGDVVNVIPVSSDVDSWLWNDGSTSASFSVSAAGIVYATGTNQCGQASDTINVSMLPATPPLDLGADVSICPGETTTLSITEPNVDILWHDATTDSEYVINNAGLVYATISNACGSVSDTIIVDLLAEVPFLDLGDDQSLCPGEMITVAPGISDVTYLWHNGTDAQTYVTTTPGQIILTISNDCGSSTDTIEVIADTNGPQVDLGPDVLACEDAVVTLNAGISGVDYLWNDGSVESELQVTSSGTYSLQVSNACGSDTDTVVVEIHGTIPSPSLGADTILCDDEVLSLISQADSETSVVWQDGSASFEFLVSQAGTYSLTETNHCGSGSDTIAISYETAPEPFDLGEDVVLCPGESIVLSAPSTNALINWHSSSGSTSTNPQYVLDAAGIVMLTLSNDCGSESDEVTVSFDQDVPVIDLGSTVSLCPQQTHALDVTQVFHATYLWNTGSVQPSIVITQPDLYAVTVSTDCYSITDDVLIEENADCDEHELFIPNVFSPNGDNVNDEWMIHVNDPTITGIQCRVFDRWGDLVFETMQIPITWNGRMNNRDVNPGVYVYMIVFKNGDGTQSIISGDITLVR